MVRQALHFYSALHNPDLVLIQDRWADLPEHIRQAVLALVRSAGGKVQSQ